MTNTEPFHKLIDLTKSLNNGDFDRLDKIFRFSNVHFKNAAPKLADSYSEQLNAIWSEFISLSRRHLVTTSEQSKWRSATIQTVNLLEAFLEELTYSVDVKFLVKDSPATTPLFENINITIGTTKRVFLVHGHDVEMKFAVARTITQFGLEPIILHEQPDQGRTIMEKFEDNAETAAFAVILLSPDDFGYASKADPSTARLRARQNVVLELGYFIGKLGRRRVVTLYREAGDFEMPTDFVGVVYKIYDSEHGSWRYALGKELREAGYEVDLNKL